MLFEKNKVKKLKAAIETRNGMEWYDAIIKKANGANANFSEYETYGNFVLSEFPGQVATNYFF